MSPERRKHPRVKVPIDGQWRTGGTRSFCRVLNVSLGGCFVREPSGPPPTDQTTVTIYFGSHGPLSFKGTVVHAEAKAGFGVEFDPLQNDLKVQLGQHLEALKVGNY